jgi:hypothetical protein
MFVHHVFFWLKESITAEDRKHFEDGVLSLPSIDVVHSGEVGKPADTNRPVIDNSYDYSLLLIFKDREAHDAYQVHPDHEKFVKGCSLLWSRVQVYDSETLG